MVLIFNTFRTITLVHY